MKWSTNKSARVVTVCLLTRSTCCRFFLFSPKCELSLGLILESFHTITATLSIKTQYISLYKTSATSIYTVTLVKLIYYSCHYPPITSYYSAITRKSENKKFWPAVDTMISLKFEFLFRSSWGRVINPEFRGEWYLVFERNFPAKEKVW